MAEASLKVTEREDKGKQAAKRLRREGLIPGILYGLGMEPSSLTIDLKELLTLLHTVGRNSVVNITVGKKRKKIKSFIYDIQHDPISGDIIHVDLKQISMKERIHVTIPVHITGTSVGVKSEGGIVEHVLHAVDILCLPTDIPEEIIVDVSDLHIGDAIFVRDLSHESYDFLSDQENLVVHIIAPKVVKVTDEEAEAVEGAAEPQVIGEEE